MATFGSSSNPVSSISGAYFDASNVIYCPLNTNVTVSGTTSEGYIFVGVASTSNATASMTQSGGNFAFNFTLTASSGSIKLQGLQGMTMTFTLYGVQPQPTADIQGSGTQADPWTRWEGSAYQFWDTVQNGGTYYTSIGAVWNVTDEGDPSYEDDYWVSRVAPGTYGIINSNYGLVGTTTSAGTVEITLDFMNEYEGVDGSKNIYLIILGAGPTLNVKVSGAWKEGKPFVKVNGAWKEASKVYIKVNGTWKESK